MATAKSSPDPNHEADFGSWLETIGFDTPDDEDVAARPAAKRETRRNEARLVAGRTYPPPAADETHVYPPLSAHASRTRLKVVAFTLGTFASLSIISVLGLAAYLSGLDRHYAPRTVAVEAAAPPSTPLLATPLLATPSPVAEAAAVAPPATITASVDPPTLESSPAQGNASPAPASPPAPSNAVVVKKPRRGLEQRGFGANPATSYADSQQSETTFQPPPPASGGGMARARVVIHVRDGSDVRAQDIAARLSSSVGRLETRRVGVAPGSYEIRFFHPEDAMAARALAEMLPVEGAWRVRDFSQFRPPPSGGTLEVWLP